MPHKGYEPTSEHKLKISQALKGREKSFEQRQEMLARLKRLRKEGLIPTNFGGKRHKFPKGYIPWNTGLSTNPGLEKMLSLPHGMIGKQHTIHTKKILSEKLKEYYKNNKGIRDGVNNPFYGKKHTPEFIQQRHQQWTGTGNPMYIDGLSPISYPLEFNKHLRQQIRTRDNFVCQLCNISENGKRHCIHHIDYNKHNNVFNNLITLCVSCNSKVNVNVNRDGWQFYFSDLLASQSITR